MAGGELRFGTASIYMPAFAHGQSASTSLMIEITWLHVSGVLRDDSNPFSGLLEWKLHRDWFGKSAMADLLGADFGLAEAHKLYACHDLLLEHKADLFSPLMAR